MIKKSVLVLVAMSLFSNLAFGECDFSTGITPLSDGGYRYSKECHIKVGENKRDLDIANKQVENLNKALDLKTLALDKSDQRIDLWRDTTFRLEDRINKIDDTYKANQWLYFGLGALTMFAAGYVAAKAIQDSRR